MSKIIAAMIDLETMDNRPTSAITAIGVVIFNKTEVIDRFYTPVNLSSSVAAGMTMSAETVKWWMNQSAAARKIYDESEGSPLNLDTALRMLSYFIKEHKPAFIFGNGSDFDNVILRTAYELSGETMPWAFWQNVCFRTMKTMFVLPEKPQRDGVHHNALQDAEYQVKWLQKIIEHRQLNML